MADPTGADVAVPEESHQRVLRITLLGYIAAVLLITQWPDPPDPGSLGWLQRALAWLHDNGLPAGEASNTAKYAAAEAAVSAIDAAIQTHGGNGLTSEYGLLPYWGLARLLKISPVSREMILNYIAQHSLGLPRSY